MKYQTEAQDYWAWRRQAVEYHNLLEWLRWQLETRWRKKQMPRNTLAKVINDFMHRTNLCMNICKSMYFCELKKKHRGRHQCAGGGLKWSSKEGFFP